jgi:acyl phosphate:glycerol-3-phosphate acyltransferase
MIVSSILIFLAYLLGSLSSAIIICKALGLTDPRTQGSKNPGATNMLRLHGKKYAAMVLIGDMLKGTIPVVIGHVFGVSEAILGWLALAAIIGHMYPIFFGFKGGKGVATALGSFLGIQLIFGLICLAIWIGIAYFKKYSSLASLVTMCLAPLLAIVLLKTAVIFNPMIMITFIIIAKHHENIQRLWYGKESKLNL